LGGPRRDPGWAPARPRHAPPSGVSGRSGAGFAAKRELLRRADPANFGDLIALARTGNATPVDGWGADPRAPRGVLAGVLKRLACEQLQERRL
jgi:hypothetical protein